MKDKLINALISEYEAVYLINLEDDTFEILKELYGSSAMVSSKCWSDAGQAFANECSEDSKEIVKLFSDPEFLRSSLTESDYQECTFRHVATDSRWRKAGVHVIERKDNLPTKVLMTTSMIDKLTYQKEQMLQRILSLKGKQWYDVNDNLAVYKMVLNEDAGEGDKLFDNIKVLLVEDNEILRIISKEILENEGAIVTEAENGQEAVDLVESEKYQFDFIIMDIIMPVMDGIAATKEISAYQKGSDIKIPILGLTADCTDEQVKKIIDAGAYACLSKPLNPVEMSKVFISCMKKRSMLMEEKMAEINLLANTDMLTQSGNIVAYTHEIADLSKELYGNHFNVSIVVCDIDNLKGINDTYGHDIGDIYIKNCCNLIKTEFKNSSLYRVGGDEFALIVRGEDFENIDDIISEFDKKSESLSSVQDVIDGKAAVSAGYAVYDTSIDQSISDTMKRADMAMYENKQLHKKWLEMYSKYPRR